LEYKSLDIERFNYVPNYNIALKEKLYFFGFANEKFTHTEMTPGHLPKGINPNYKLGRDTVLISVMVFPGCTCGCLS